MEQINDAGGLIAEAFDAAAEHLLPKLAYQTDPRDGTVAPVLVERSGLTAVSPAYFDNWRARPLARKGTAALTTLDSFIDHVNRFKLPNSAVFARDSMDSAKLLAIYDYHPAVTEGQDEARNLWHMATYAFPLSDEWKAWHGSNAKPMPMADFAAFLEDRIVDVVAEAEPTGEHAKAFVKAVGGKMASPTRLVELSRSLTIYENSVLKDAKNLSSGEGQLTFDSTHTDADGKPINVPNLFMICVPIFARAPVSYRLLARLRYRKTAGGVVFWYELWRADLAFEQAFADACTEVREKTGLPLLVGSPES